MQTNPNGDRVEYRAKILSQFSPLISTHLTAGLKIDSRPRAGILSLDRSENHKLGGKSMLESSSQVADAFRAFCGDERFSKFVRELDGRARHKASLRYWQEILWAEFSNTYSSALPQSAADIAQLFGIPVPASALQWYELIDDSSYVVDLVQLDSGIRYLQSRECSAPVTPHTAFTSRPCCGGEIKRLLSSGQVVPLESGHQFCVEAHGVWMTVEEAEWLDDDNASADGPEPWVNGMPPVLPPI